VDALVRTIPVRDANGDELTVYEYRDRRHRTILGLRFARKVRRLVLCTGEPVEYVSETVFALVSTGEELRRIETP
jgi:hypothetical protein